MVNITNSEIHNNTAQFGGGGASLHGQITITNSIFRNNSSGNNGGGLYFRGGDLTLENSTIYGNYAARRGGGFYHDLGTATLRHVTIFGNRADSAGGGIYRDGGILNLFNSIIAGSTTDGVTEQGECQGSIESSVNNLVDDGGCSADYSGNAGLASAPQGSPPYYPLLASSQAIGKGHADHCLSTDQRGESRPDTGCDLGAYEHARSSPLVTTGGRSDVSEPVATLSTGEILVNQGYRLWATYGLRSGVEFQRVDAVGVAIQSVLDMGLLDAIDVWSYVSQGVEVCFPQQGDIVFLDASTSPRTVTTVSFTYVGGFTCAKIATAGTLALVSAGPATPTFSDEPVTLSGCQINTSAMVNMRDAPDGSQVLLVFMPGSVFATDLRASGWFKVEYQGIPGWISADYVTTQGSYLKRRLKERSEAI